MIDVGSAVGYLMLNTDGFKSGFRSAMDDLKTFQDQSATAGDKFSALGSSMTSVGGTLTKSVTLPIVGIGVAALAVGNDFEAQMSRVQGIAGATGDELELLKDQALQLGADTAFSAAEAAAGMENLASAGFNTTEIMAAMPGLLDLAASSGAEVGKASEIAASAIRGFGLEASDAGHVADVFALAAARTNAQTEDMGDAMKYVAPVAKAMGQSLEETAAAIGIMSDAGIKGSQAGTALRGAMSRLAKPSEAMVMTMKDLGLNFYDTNGDMLPLNEQISMMETNMAGLTQEQKNQALVTLFGQESLSGMLALMDRGPETLIELTDSFKNADGASADMATTMLDNTKGSIDQMMGSLETFGIKIQEVLAPVIRGVVDNMTGFINGLSSMDEGTLQMIITIAGAVAAIGPLLLIFGKVAGVIGTITTAIAGAGGFSAAMATMGAVVTGPIGIIIAAVAALALAWATDFGGIREATASIFESIQSIFTTVLGVITDLWNSNFLGIQEITKFVWESIQLIFSTIFDTIAGLFEVFSLAFSGDWEGAWEKVKEIASNLWETIKTLFGNFLNIIVDTLIRIGVRLLQAAKDALENVKAGFQFVWKTIMDWLTMAINDPIGTITGIGLAMFEAGKGIFTMLWDGLKAVWEEITSWVTKAIDWIVSKVKFWQDESEKISSPTTGTGFTGGGSPSGGFGGSYTPQSPKGGPVSPQASATNVGNGGGDNYNFYSPMALDPITAAQEMKKAKRELAMGFG